MFVIISLVDGELVGLVEVAVLEIVVIASVLEKIEVI